VRRVDDVSRTIQARGHSSEMAPGGFHAGALGSAIAATANSSHLNRPPAGL